ncbi:E3 ubiquitin-protein ligase AIRP2-like [Triticum dicoccoides]|uniref:E3 ubiquitin-protein ligase AIRP2-like n=1 Tax=Triticum dicoccoides TaxID=85692 RepID=UPI001890A1D2|nr:E3 ubiquitin-protein ligase AIRP2-like [Triticum dicoccoides]
MAAAAAAPCASRRSFRDSLKVPEADIQHANALASDFSPDYDGAACLQMRMPYSPAARSFLSPPQRADCSLAGAPRPASSGSPSSRSTRFMWTAPQP